MDNSLGGEELLRSADPYQYGRLKIMKAEFIKRDAKGSQPACCLFSGAWFMGGVESGILQQRKRR
ncbi:hypothetical protein N7519_004019 [Penicillium mononematosum]|uniref:uncharacterized protein n=1 Tax=Penicillium mononematosum TaxID=268346 RepID=UPI002549B675|nr:uncharacterized protein N7519_004019 [Penicillium mononematosum]KAJ6189111.1 hypothetical protein N7519_004019 [Penicillium mononematosum]